MFAGQLLQKAFNEIDAYNAKDPNLVPWEGKYYPKEWLDSIRHTEWLDKLWPDAPDDLKIAARSQHIGRWKILRESFPMTRSGYLAWRIECQQFHAETTSVILKEVGYDNETIESVKNINLKQNLKLNPGTQCIEDVLCLVFLQYHFEEFTDKHSEEKVIHILQRTWKKMSKKGQQAALTITYTEKTEKILAKALNGN